MIIGTPEEVKQAASQLDILFETQPHAVLVGSLGRAAMYAAFVEHMRDVAPDEFLPMGFYAPFEQHLQLNRH
jgi:hypothetical protein